MWKDLLNKSKLICKGNIVSFYPPYKQIHQMQITISLSDWSRQKLSVFKPIYFSSYKPELYETKSTWSNSISNSPSVSPLNISPAITPILLSPAMSTKQMSIGSSSPSSSTRSLSSLGSKRRNYPDISEAQPQNQNFLTPHFVPKLKGCKSKESIRTKEEVFSSDQKSQSLGCLEMVERNDDKQIGAMKQID